MKTTKRAVAMYFNLKGYYDIILFKNGHDKNKFVKDYNKLYQAMENEDVDCELFMDEQSNMFEYFGVEPLEEYYDKDIAEDSDYNKYIMYNNEKIIITDFLRYGY